MYMKVLEWFVHGECGISSKAMACAVIGMKPNERWKFANHPSDPSDFRRCLKFLSAVPEARNCMDKVARLSPVWEKLVDNWEELEALFLEEYPQNWAPRLYERMKSLGC